MKRTSRESTWFKGGCNDDYRLKLNKLYSAAVDEPCQPQTHTLECVLVQVGFQTHMHLVYVYQTLDIESQLSQCQSLYKLPILYSNVMKSQVFTNTNNP